LRFSKASGRLYESDPRENAKRRSIARAMIDPAWGVEPPMDKGSPLYSPAGERQGESLTALERRVSS
jgi:hypothetical protein